MADDFRVRVDIQDEELRTWLKEATARAFDLKPVMGEIGAVVRSSIIKNFQVGGRPKKWKPNALATIMGGIRKRDLKKRSGLKAASERRLKTGMVLVKTARLRNSITYRAFRAMVEIGTNVVYAAIQNFGGKAGHGRKVTIPAREYLLVQDEDWPVIKTAINDYLVIAHLGRP